MAIDSKTRKMMGEQAVQLARKVGYSSAGTVEFLVDKHRRFYFLEMNTRLQVEHPITEYITNMDLVEQMIRVAAGQKLQIGQSDVKINGWAFESRVYAEDPKLFLPSIGRLSRYIEPLEPGNKEIRCDSGIKEGSEISIYYDPLICKLCTYGPDRESAINTMERALDSYVIRGVTHNIPVIREVLSQKRFQEGKITTNYLPEEFPGGFTGHKLLDRETAQLSAAAALIYGKQLLKMNKEQKLPEEVVVTIEGLDSVCTVRQLEESKFLVNHNGNSSNVSLIGDWKANSPLLKLTIDGVPMTLQFHGSPYTGNISLQAWGTVYNLHVRTRLESELARFMPARKASSSDRVVKAPMAGQIVSISVKVGDTVRQGGELAIIEAMKMQNVLRASKPGKVVSININAGQNVASDQSLIELEYF